MQISKSIFKNILALLLGSSTVLAFAPYNYFFLTPITLFSLLWLWQQSSAKTAFITGLLFGLGFFGFGAWWIYISLHTFGQSPVILAVLITALFIIALACFPALTGYFLNRFFQKKLISRYVLAFPSLWVLTEWIRSWILTGFPWLLLGYSQTDGFLQGFSPLIGVYGISWLLAAIAGLAAAILFAQKKHRLWLLLPILLAFLLVAAWLLKPITWTKPASEKFNVALLQGNIAQTVKWRPEQLAETLTIYRHMIEQAPKAKLMVLPEAAITLTQTQAENYLEGLENTALKQQQTIVVGMPLLDENKYYNGALSLGQNNSIYFKRHLVPFGEYMPFRPLLKWLSNYILIPMSDFTAGDEKQKPFYVLDNLQAAIYICYEIAYQNLVLSDFPQAQLMMVISDDSWFGDSIAAAQHLQIVQMRAQETGRYALVSTNDGITAIIDPQGRILVQAPRYQRMILRGEITAMKGATPLICCGAISIMLLAMLLLALALVRQYRFR